MLHIAPELFFEWKFKQIPSLLYLTADLYDPNAMAKMDITDIQYPGNSFDIIYCSHVLEHVPNDLEAMREFKRVLKPGGWALLVVPITSEKTFEDTSITSPIERQKVFGHSSHVRGYGPDFKDRLVEAGFKVTVVTATEVIGGKDFLRMGISSAEKSFFCEK